MAALTLMSVRAAAIIAIGTPHVQTFLAILFVHVIQGSQAMASTVSVSLGTQSLFAIESFPFECLYHGF